MVNRSAGKGLEMMKDKRGIFFTILVILIFSLFLVSFTFYSGIKERKTTQKRVESMNSFLLSAEEDLPRKLFVSGFRSVFLIESEIVETGAYASDLNGKFQEIFFNGTLNQEPQELMLGATYPEIAQSIQEKADKINVNLTFANPSLSVSQKDPWNIEFSLALYLTMQDKGGLASWNKTETIIALVSVENFEDPLYLIGTNGLVVNKIAKTPFLTFVSGNDIANLSMHSQNSYYTAHSDAPSFLNRLQGLTTRDLNGIESLVNLQKLSQSGVNVKDKTVVDYIYFSTDNPTACNVLPAGMPSWFKLDSDHLSLYNVTCQS